MMARSVGPSIGEGCGRVADDVRLSGLNRHQPAGKTSRE
jgi:hypothetical protein